ncbi:hypothetical protein ABIA85_009651 [Bradyrhizobium sp. LA6.10]|uniref:hypothetical protein n=1 Tax=Bradyrhizobium sp. LA6.10 TaxID=3156318 RepID=UPI0033945911
MNSVGDPSKWSDLIDSLVPDIVQLVLDTWQGMPALSRDELEDPTTKALCRLLKLNRTAADLPFRIDTQFVELDPAAGEDEGRCDIIFSPPINREDIYFCLECKRLNVPRFKGVRTYASEYVSFGMLRFVRGQYAPRVRHGGMLGYVLNGNIDSAIRSVTAAIVRRATDLGMAPATVLASTVQPTNRNMRETKHRRTQGLGPFQVQHMFVANRPNT